MNEWKPIESAPDDDTPILVFDLHEEFEEKVQMAYRSSDHAWASMSHKACDGGARILFPTHWMPLPEPPTPTTD